MLGLTTNLRFLRWLVRQPVVRDGEVRIDTLERIWPPDDWAARTAVPEAVAALGARTLLDAGSGLDGWRLNGPARVRLEVDGDERTVGLSAVGSEDERGAAAATPTSSAAFVRAGDTVFVDVAGRSTPIRLAPPPDVDRAARAAASHHGGPAELVAPMPGAVIAVHAQAGARVEAGDPVVTLEAMKMEHAVVAPVAGTVAELAVRPGDQVTRGQALATVEP